MKVSEKFSEWMDRYWTVLDIIFGIAFTLFLALFKPHTDLANYSLNVSISVCDVVREAARERLSAHNGYGQLFSSFFRWMLSIPTYKESEAVLAPPYCARY